MQLVTNLNDGGAGSLRAAIAAAAPNEEIQFSVTGVILLTSTELLINKNLIITGPGSGILNVSGGGGRRIFNTDTGVISITGLTLDNGVSVQGGGIHNEATLTLNDVIVTDCITSNEGGGIWNSSSIIATNLIVKDSSADPGSGGGIYNTGTITADNLLVHGNNATVDGGGIWNNGTITHNGGSLSDNQIVTSGTGAGLYNAGTSGTYNAEDVANDINFILAGSNTAGGIYNNFGTVGLVRSTISRSNVAGIFNDAGTITINNSTISSNASVGILNILGSVDFKHSTIVQNLYGLIQDPGSACSIYNTILSGNSINDYDGDTADCTSNGHNIFGVQTNPITLAAGDQTVLTSVALVIGPLQNNTGPTETHALLAGSPAIDAGDNTAAPATDQRGQPRIQNGTIDIGAYEAVASGDCLVFTGELPTWITQAGNCLTGLAGTFTASTKEAANALAQAALQAFFDQQQAADTLNCGVPTACSDRESQTVNGELTVASAQSTIRGPGTFYCYEFQISAIAGKNISVWAGSADFDVYLYLLDDTGTTILAEAETGGFNRVGDTFDNVALNYTSVANATLTVQVTTKAPEAVGTFSTMVTDGVEFVNTPIQGPWVEAFVESTGKLFVLGTYSRGGTYGAHVSVIDTTTDSMVVIELMNPGYGLPAIFYNPNDDSVWAAASLTGSGGGASSIFRLDPDTGAILESFIIGEGCYMFPAFVPGLNKLFCGKMGGIVSDKLSVFNCSTRLYELPGITAVETSNRSCGVYIPELDRVITQASSSTGYQIINPNDKTISGFIANTVDIVNGFYLPATGLFYGFQTTGHVGTEIRAVDILTGVTQMSVVDSNEKYNFAYNPCRDCLMIGTRSNSGGFFAVNALNLSDFTFIDCTMVGQIGNASIVWPQLVSASSINRMYLIVGRTDIDPLVGAAYRIA